ncbi:MAG: glycolate oxidase subunit GlcE [Gammaproteobacteria bacterium]|nr:glycolate oxidase subunit GlcE [Gammaproteobacteria bacterium]
MAADRSAALQDRVSEAAAHMTPLHIIGGNTKHFYGRATNGTPLPVREHCGIVSYQPSELVITARGGTPLSEIEAALDERRQMLAFEPPHFGADATVGGAIACGLSGPRRPYAGAVRDFVLGVKILNGKGEILKFGGEVMKNVAGFDVSRLMAGALGTLGVLLEISLKVLPKPQTELTLSFQTTAQEAIALLNTLNSRPLPLSAACHDGEILRVRLFGSDTAVRAAHRKIGGIVDDAGATFWERVREHKHGFFNDTAPLWRLSAPPAVLPLNLPGQWLIDWGGAQRWLKNPLPAEVIRETVARLGGHATLFRNGERKGQVFHPLPPAMLAIHKRLKSAFDPHGIFNPGRLYADF